MTDPVYCDICGCDGDAPENMGGGYFAGSALCPVCLEEFSSCVDVVYFDPARSFGDNVRAWRNSESENDWS